VFILSQDPSQKFQVNGYVQFDGKVLSAAFHVEKGEPQILALLENNLLAGAKVPQRVTGTRMEPLSHEEVEVRYRKVDRGSALVIANQLTGDIFVTGDDKLLKKYEYPSETMEQMDFKRAP
jgi:hypothetical protein